MIFPQAIRTDTEAAFQHSTYLSWLDLYGGLPRHPSQLYQMALEGLLLFVVVWCFAHKTKRSNWGRVTALFLMGYGLARFLVEFTREPDAYLGLLSLGLSMGQWLSVPMMLVGVILWVYAGRTSPHASRINPHSERECS
jgi:phosphatidylglycerol:prolipoprotein diacylglycerol transferase